MPYSRDGTERRPDRVTRPLAVVFLIVAIVTLIAAWQLQARNQQHLDALRGDNPADQILIPPDLPADPVGSVDVASAAPDESMTPTRLAVQAIGIDTTVAAKPTRKTEDPFLRKVVDSFGVPDDMYTTTWWSSGPKPGSAGMAVILGHTQINGYGVFNKLGSLHDGDRVLLTGKGGTALRFTVVDVRSGISKTDPYALRDTLQGHPDDAALALITCSGTFDTKFDQSAENTVVFAKLATV